MLAVIKTGGKQYVVRPGQTIKVEKLDVPAGDEVIFHEVLLKGEGDTVEVGAPLVESAAVKGQVVAQKRAKKVIVLRYHAKTRYRKKRGHRQPLTEVKIVSLE
jgi:large subunit ribosomal protein L21